MERRLFVAFMMLLLTLLLAGGQAAAQEQIVCQAQGTLNLTGTLNSIQCWSGSGTLLWSVSAVNSTTLQIEYVPDTDTYQVAVNPGYHNHQCDTDSGGDPNACLDLYQGTEGTNTLAVSMVGTEKE